jgi:NADPH-dependent 2,4-dienoyl-CoA reductase/sulfur reductase-like enzyme/rhodanese-related sulfurtransferase
VGSLSQLLSTSYGIPRDADFFETSKGFTAVTSAEVVRIDRKNKAVTLKMLETGEVVEHKYGRLVIATGALPADPPMPAPESDRVRPFTRPADVIGFRSLAERGEIGRVAIIGGGFIGVELCEAVTEMWGIEAALYEKQQQLLPDMLDPEMAEILQRAIEAQGVGVHVGSDVGKIELDADGKPVVFVGSRDPETVDYVFLCLGVQPEVTLALECGLEIGGTGGIRVDKALQTSDPDIYAGGDCIESTHQLTGKPLFIPMGSLANRHGRVIAENLAGNPTEFPGALGAFVLRAFETNAGGVGLSEAAARGEGIDARSVWGSFGDKPDYNPDMKTFTLKIVYEAGGNRLLGLQAVGKGDICRRIDVFSSMLQKSGTLDDLFDLEHGYAPPFAEALDPLHHLAGVAEARQRGAAFIGPGGLAESLDKDTVLLDVREEEEAENVPLPSEVTGAARQTVVIPLNRLKERLGEFDGGDRIVVICRRGPRSYQAAMILEAAGFERVEVAAAGLQAFL